MIAINSGNSAAIVARETCLDLIEAYTDVLVSKLQSTLGAICNEMRDSSIRVVFPFPFCSEIDPLTKISPCALRNAMCSSRFSQRDDRLDDGNQCNQEYHGEKPKRYRDSGNSNAENKVKYGDHPVLERWPDESRQISENPKNDARKNSGNYLGFNAVFGGHSLC